MIGNRIIFLFEQLRAKNIVKTRKDFCDILGIDYKSLAKYVDGRIGFSVNSQNFDKFKKAGVSINWLLTGNGDVFLKEDVEPPKPAILQELEKVAKEAAKETIAEQEQELIRMKLQLENLIQEKEYAEQEKRLANVETRLQELEDLYDLYYNAPEENKPRKIIQRKANSKGSLTERTGTAYPDGTFVEDVETVQESAPAYTADYKEPAEPEETVDLPLIRSLAAGIPIEAIDINETYPVPKRLIKKNKKYCVAKIKGSSMTEAGIKDGSYV
ncbi:S24 family peptidase, partial [Treponema pedis]|uniref:LexA family protein n=1 Tax=Treponema pedis TaxID=409322 RepID=UPI003D201598